MIHLHLAARENGRWSKTRFAPAPVTSAPIDYARPTLVLIHGYGAIEGAERVYRDLEPLFPDLQVIGVYWPSSGGFGSQLGSYFRADARTAEAAAMLWSALHLFTAPVVLQGHSLGCDVLYDYSRLAPHHRIILTAPAVPFDRPYFSHRAPVVYHSRKDGVLRWAFRSASLFMYRFAPALGLNGPEPGIAGNFRTRDCSTFVDSHGAYPYIPRWRGEFQRDVEEALKAA